MRVSENWRLKKQRYTLEGTINEGKVAFPPRPVEPRPVETYDFNKPEQPYVWPVNLYEKVGS